MSTIGIIGYGFVGKAVRYGFVGHDEETGKRPLHRVLVYDKFKSLDSLGKVVEESEIIFVCLPTPYHQERLQIDLSIIDEVIGTIAPRLEEQGKIVCIKSTVVPGTTTGYATKYPRVPFAFNPEFLTEANYLQDFLHPDRIIIGASNDWVKQRLVDLYMSLWSDRPI
jgi:UDPglucose 6-dehydrogenase